MRALEPTTGRALAWAVLFLGTALAGCATQTGRIRNVGGLPSAYVDPTQTGPLSGTGFESNDIAAACGKMVQSMLQNPRLVKAETPPRVIIDDTAFTNNSTMVLNIDLFTERMVTDLTMAANGRMAFLARKNVDEVLRERELKDTQFVDAGTAGRTQAIAGADYKLILVLTSQHLRDQSNLRSDYYLLAAKLIDLETTEIVWADRFDVKKVGQDDVVYR